MSDATDRASTIETVLRAHLAGLGREDDRERVDVERALGVLDRGNAWSRRAPLHLTSSALIVHRPTGQVLLRWHQRQQAWLQVGGHADDGEHDPLTIAVREAQEETGLSDLAIGNGGAALHLVIVPVPADDREPAHEHADIRFVLETLRPGDARPENPTAPLRWLSFEEALALTTEENLRETLRRALRLLGAGGPR